MLHTKVINHKTSYKKTLKKINKTSNNKMYKKYDRVFTIIHSKNPNEQEFNFSLLRKILSKYHLDECNQEDCMNKKPMFVWMNHNENSTIKLRQKYYNTQIYLQNRLINFDKITSKEKLHINMKKLFPSVYKKHLKKSFLLTKILSYKTLAPDVYISRPINVIKSKLLKGEKPAGYSGKDIIIVHDELSLNIAQNNLLRYDNVLMSEYINNPVLFKHRKFHIRTYLLIYKINNIFKIDIAKFGNIYTAKELYKNDDYANINIHDTHLRSTDLDYFFPTDFTNKNLNVENITKNTISNIFLQITTILTTASKIIKNDITTYSNVKNGFYIFGVDLMIEYNKDNTNKYNVILLEINEKAGFKTLSLQGRKTLDTLIFNWLNNTIFKHIFT